MSRVAALPVIGSALLAACATAPDDVSSSSLAAESVPQEAIVRAAAEAPADAPAVGDVKTVDLAELDTGLVCETKRRAGSRIGATVCTTREQRAAIEQERAAAAREYARALDRDRARRDDQSRMPGAASQAPASVIVFQ